VANFIACHVHTSSDAMCFGLCDQSALLPCRWRERSKEVGLANDVFGQSSICWQVTERILSLSLIQSPCCWRTYPSTFTLPAEMGKLTIEKSSTKMASPQKYVQFPQDLEQIHIIECTNEVKLLFSSFQTLSGYQPHNFSIHPSQHMAS